MHNNKHNNIHNNNSKLNKKMEKKNYKEKSSWYLYLPTFLTFWLWEEKTSN